jgi:hypothetical protein
MLGQISDMDKTALLEEYKSLRSEIQKRQETRTIILGFSITATGTVMSLIITNIANITLGIYGLTGLIAFLLMILITSTMLTINHSKSIVFVADYIACFIEPYFPLMGWEHRSVAINAMLRPNRKYKMPLGQSRFFAIHYLFLLIFVYTFALIIKLYLHPWHFFGITVLGIVQLSMCVDLYFHTSSGWRIDWTIIRNIIQPIP